MLLDNILEEETILERVDEYSIYSFYIGKELELGTAYNSPLRDDDGIPSFAMYLYKGKIFFKDHALGISGTVLTFVRELFRYTTYLDAMSRVNIDFDLGLFGGNPNIAKLGEKPKLSNGYKVRKKVQAIKVSSVEKNSTAYIEFWNRYGITLDVLKYYNVTEVDIIQYVYKSSTLVVYPKELTIAYRIYLKYKIYTPFGDKAKKFLNNYPINYVEGYLQLKYEKNFLVITKALKEIMFFRSHFDWDSSAGKSENTMIRRHIMLKLVQRYKYIFIWLDNDVAGIRAQKAYMEEYPFLIPIFHDVEEKDPTDYWEKANDKKSALKEIKNLIMNKL